MFVLCPVCPMFSVSVSLDSALWLFVSPVSLNFVFLGRITGMLVLSKWR